MGQLTRAKELLYDYSLECVMVNVVKEVNMRVPWVDITDLWQTKLEPNHP